MKKIKIIAIIGKAGVGKDFWLHRICEDDEEVHEIVSCTTRPARWLEVDGKNYHFLTDEQFTSQDFIESCMFRGWRYGTRKNDLDENKINIGIFNLNGIEQLLKRSDIDLTIIYLKAVAKIRLIRQLERDATDIEEIFRRYYTDKEDFNESRLDSIKKQVPFYTILNNSTNFYDDDNEFILEDFDNIINEVKNK